MLPIKEGKIFFQRSLEVSLRAREGTFSIRDRGLALCGLGLWRLQSENTHSERTEEGCAAESLTRERASDVCLALSAC